MIGGPMLSDPNTKKPLNVPVPAAAPARACRV